MGKIKEYIKRKLGILSLRENLIDLKKKIDTLKKENQKLSNRLKDANNEISTLRKTCEETKRELYGCIDELKKKNAVSEKQILLMEKKLANNDKIFIKQQDQISNLEKYIFLNERGLSPNERTPRIIVSLTSYPARIGVVPIVLERLLVQTVRPDKIVLWLSKEQFPMREKELPDDLLAMRDHGVEICWCDGDMKAYKKVLPALREYPDDLIVLVDDDLIYKVDFIEKLYHAYLEHPSSIIASRVHKIEHDDNGSLLPYAEWKMECDFGKNIERRDWFFTSGAGTLIPARVFSEDIFDEQVIKELCPYADDIWLNIHTAIHGITIVNIASNHKLTYVEGTQEECLWCVNKNKNDEQLKNLMEHYKNELLGTIYEI